VKETVVQSFVSRGIAPGRIDCDAAKGHYAYLESHHQVDIMLDFFPFTGFTTTCESLWMGVPMVTLQGLTHRERVSASFLTAAGYPELIANTKDEYIQIATTLAQNIPRLAHMRATMRETLLHSALMDVPRYLKHFEAALLNIVAAH